MSCPGHVVGVEFRSCSPGIVWGGEVMLMGGCLVGE